MTTLITGGSKCGKSHLAEKLLDNCADKIYIATMRPFGEEAFAAIERHCKIRAGKGFVTIEKYIDIHEINVPQNSAVLLECMSNLCANEMFRNEEICDPTELIICGIQHIQSCAKTLVIVTNNVGSDGIDYGEKTNKYIEVMGRLNTLVSTISDNVVECVYSVPVVLKGSL